MKNSNEKPCWERKPIKSEVKVILEKSEIERLTKIRNTNSDIIFSAQGRGEDIAEEPYWTLGWELRDAILTLNYAGIYN